MLQGGGARLYTMIHWAPLPLEFLVRMAPFFAIGWEMACPTSPFSESWSCHLHTLFSAIEVAGHIVVILQVFIKLLFTHKQLLHSLSQASIFRFGHVVANSYTVHCFLFCVAPTLPFGGRAYSWLGRRFVCKEFLGNLCGRCSRASRFSIMARRNSSRSHDEAHEHSSSNRYLSFSRLNTRTP